MTDAFTNIFCRSLLTFGLLVCVGRNCIAGPPLITDDPGILNPGTWEVILAVAGEDRPASSVIQAPMLDISLGVTRDTQVSFLLPHTIIKVEQNSQNSGLGHASFGYKWRGVSTPKWEIAIASNYMLPVTSEAITADDADETRLLGLPVLVSYFVGNWTYHGQFGWNIDSHGARYWDFGLAASHPLGASTQWMVEIFGNADASFDNGTLNYQIGIDFEIVSSLHLLTSVGSRVKSAPERAGRLNFCFYAGLQWFYGS